MSDPELPFLLDTHAAIWIFHNIPIAPAAQAAVDQAYASAIPVYVSPITAWEVGMLVRHGRLVFSARPEVWVEQLLEVPGVYLAPMPPTILVLSSFLPGAPPKDPADRIIAATAREYGYRLVTRDRGLLAYSEAGHIQAIPC